MLGKRIKWAVIALAAATGSTVLAGCGSDASPAPSGSPSEVIVTKVPANISVARGRIISVQLQENPSTGFTWTVTDETGRAVVPGQPANNDPANGPAAVIMKTPPTYTPTSTDKPGSGGTSTTTFATQRQGSAVFNFVYARTGTTDGATTSQLTIRVT